MATAFGISRDIQVSFPIFEVKSIIDKVCAASKSHYMVKSKDDIMNTYSIQMMGGFAVFVTVSIQLKKLSETETQILITSNKATNTANQANDIIDKFLGLVSRGLSGEVIDEKIVAQGKSGCLGSFIALAGIGLGLLYLLCQ